MERQTDLERLTDRVVNLEEKISQLQTELLLSRYFTISVFKHVLVREPLEIQQNVCDRVLHEFAAMAEIDGWSEELKSILAFDGERPVGLIRRRSLTAPDYL